MCGHKSIPKENDEEKVKETISLISYWNDRIGGM